MKIFLLAIVFLFSIVINNDKLRAETVGHFYWHLPSIRFNSNTSVLPASATGTGFHVAAGNLKKPAHLADIGFQYYSQQIQSEAFQPGLLNEFYLGYVYHYSTSYDTSEKSHNIHFGIGFTSLGWRLAGDITIQTTSPGIANYNLSGLYTRLSYFRAFPQRGKEGRQTLIGLNLTLKSYTGGSGVIANSSETLSGTVISPAGYNSMDLALILGVNF